MDIETTLRRILLEAIKTYGFRLPVTIATVAANDAVLFTRFTAAPPGSPPGSVSLEHVTGHIDEDAGFLAPIHLMVRDSTGRAKLAVQRGSGQPVFVDGST